MKNTIMPKRKSPIGQGMQPSEVEKQQIAEAIHSLRQEVQTLRSIIERMRIDMQVLFRNCQVHSMSAVLLATINDLRETLEHAMVREDLDDSSNQDQPQPTRSTEFEEEAAKRDRERIRPSNDFPTRVHSSQPSTLPTQQQTMFG